MKTKLLIPLFLTLGLFAACAEMKPHPMDMTQAVQNAKTKADHEALAKHYDEAADDMQAKVDEHKKLLAHYEKEPYLYPKQTPSMTAHCQMLINAYQSAVEENRAMADGHRSMAQ
jgi:hypothetical protein